ncbi:MAG: hypothetical protein SOZ04_01335 [Bacilli bacterium]|nr:hypothetical protein [Bacilli bacterium]
MKQVLKSIKRKYLVGGIAAFAGVSLLTTGVATWVIGANSTAQKDVTVTVDGKQNNSASIEIGGVSPLKIGEQSNVNSGFVQVTNANAENMKITLTNIKYSYSSSFTSTGVAIKFSIDYGYNSEGAATSNLGNLVTESKIGDKRTTAKDGKSNNKSDADSWQYIVAPEKATGLETGADTTHTITSLVVEFKWGSFFGGKTPSSYYNGLKLSTVADAKNVEDELDAMGKALKSISLTAELVQA